MLITNTGDATLFIAKIDVLLESTFALTIADKTYKGGTAAVFDPPLVVAAQTGVQAKITFKPTDSKKRQGELRVISNDPSFVGGLPVLVVGNTKVPCIEVTPGPVVSFGAVEHGKTSTQSISVSNCGTEQLTVEGFALKAGHAAYGLDWLPVQKTHPKIDAKLGPSAEAPIVLATNGLFVVAVTYTPPTLSKEDPSTQGLIADIGTIDVVSNAQPISLKLTGVCVNKVCPEAKIVVAEGEQVLPQAVLHLKGDGSLAPGGGTISKYKWSVQKQPEGSKQSFVPSSSTPNPTFQTNIAGEYVLCLDVFDDSSPATKSCTTACQTIFAIPSQALHVELLWKTPADADETDKGQGVGADIDLHFAHPLAQGPDQDCDGEADPWFSAPFDAFWFNATPKWGSAATEDDDARLDLDDTDGAGPENVNLNAPQGVAAEPLLYSLGVHYWNDFGFGKSYATVRIYVLGKQVVEIADQELKPVDMWYVGKINWPNEAMGGQGPVLKQCFQSGNACLGKKDPNDPKGGKLWQTQGAPCITPCYLSPLANSSSAVCK